MLKKILISTLLLSITALIASRAYLTSERHDEIIQLDVPIEVPIVEGRKELISSVGGKVVFDSNRSGTFGIYTIKANGQEVTKIYDSELQDMYPDPSPDGEWIVFTVSKTLKRDSYADVWIVRRDGSDAKLLAKDGKAATFSGDGKTVYFERDRRKIIAVDVSGENEREIFPGEENKFGNYYVIKPRVSDDGKQAAFISDRNGRWHSWIADLETKEARLMGRGCEASFYPSSSELVWIQKKGAGAKAGSGIFKYDQKTNISKKLQDDGPPMGHEYFPEIDQSGRFLLYSACPHDQHSHEDSNYQLYIKDLKSGYHHRITLDPYTNRWPKLLVDKEEKVGLEP